MVKKSSLWLFLLLLLSSSVSFAQGDLEIFGFAQAKVQKFSDDSKTTVFTTNPDGSVTEKVTKDGGRNYLSGSVQELNLFFRKELSSSFTAWVNLEFVNSYSSERNWGVFNLEEAWVNYKYADYLNVKAGLLIPKFNNLNEVKNRMPLLPYVLRPLIYETAWKTIFKTSNYLPERAFLQIYGNMPVNNLNFDYAVFLGNAEDDYVNGSTKTVTGADTTNYKTFGGRVGVTYNELRFGVSAAFDKDNQQATIQEAVSRTKIGADLGYSFHNLFLEAEVIKVLLDPKNSTLDMDKLYYYGVLGYNFNEKIYTYAGYNYLLDKTNTMLKDGYKGVLCGVGYKPIEQVVVKAEFYNSLAKTEISAPASLTKMDVDIKAINLAISVLF